jgi:hypothetical protein
LLTDRGRWLMVGFDETKATFASRRLPAEPSTRDGSAISMPSPRRLQRGFDASVGEVLALVEALGILPQQYLNALPRAFGQPARIPSAASVTPARG